MLWCIFFCGRRYFVKTVAYRLGLRRHHFAVGSIYVCSCLTIFVFSRAGHNGIAAFQCEAQCVNLLRSVVVVHMHDSLGVLVLRASALEGNWTSARPWLAELLSSGAVALIPFFCNLSFKILSACHSRGSLLETRATEVRVVPLYIHSKGSSQWNCRHLTSAIIQR